MKIGVIGAGNIGSTLARLWSRAGHDIMLSSRHPEALDDLALEIGVRTGSPLDAAHHGETILLSVPLSSIVQLDDPTKEALTGKIVIDTSNAYDQRDGHVYRNDRPHPGGSSKWVAETLEHAQVVKAFNTLYFATLLDDSGKQVSIPLASDSEHGAEVASALIRDAGYEPFYVGSLSEGRYFEPGTAPYGKSVSKNDLIILIQQEVRKHT